MKKTLEIYALIVCFFTLVWFASALISFSDQITRVIYPQITVPANSIPPSTSKQPSTGKRELVASTSQSNDEYTLQKEKRDATKDALHQFITLLVTGIIFGFHWKLFRSEKLAN